MASSSTKSSAKPLLILDFDSTVIDVNSDTYVPEQLSKTVAGRMLELRRAKKDDTSYNWTDLMDDVMQLLHQVTKWACGCVVCVWACGPVAAWCMWACGRVGAWCVWSVV